MKTTLLLALGLLTVASAPANGQYQHKIGLYADPGHTTTEAFDHSPGTLTVYVVHEAQPIGGSGVSSAFRIVASPGFTGVWLGETTSFRFLGTSSTGIAIAYPCTSLPVGVLEVWYTLFGTSEECSYLQAVAHPDYDYFGGVPVIIDCDFDPPRPAPGGKLTINPNPTCSAVPVEPSTWGKVKALYR